MRALLVTVGFAVGVGLAASQAVAAPLDGSAPILCAFTSVTECSQGGECQRSSAEAADVPAFIRVNVPRNELSTLDGKRTSPIAKVERLNGRLMIQGLQNARVWGAVIDETTGQMGATVSEADGAIVISGACVAP